jgi:hypothetical protein
MKQAVEADQLARRHVAAVAAPDRQPVCGVQHRQRERPSADQYSRSIFRSGRRRPAMVITVSAASSRAPAGGRPKKSSASGISAVSSSSG